MKINAIAKTQCDNLCLVIRPPNLLPRRGPPPTPPPPRLSDNNSLVYLYRPILHRHTLICVKLCSNIGFRQQ